MPKKSDVMLEVKEEIQQEEDFEFTFEAGAQKYVINEQEYIEIIDQKEESKSYPYKTVLQRIDRDGKPDTLNFSVKTLEEAVVIANRMFGFVGPFEPEETVEAKVVAEKDPSKLGSFSIK